MDLDAMMKDVINMAWSMVVHKEERQVDVNPIKSKEGETLPLDCAYNYIGFLIKIQSKYIYILEEIIIAKTWYI